MSEPIEYTAMLHGYIRLDKDNNLCRRTGKPEVSQEHCDFDDNPDGWNVWLRRDYPERKQKKFNQKAHLEPFDSHPDYDRDFTNLEKARAYAKEISIKFAPQDGGYVDEY